MDTNAAAFVNANRLWERHMEMARHGATRAGGVNRQALSNEDFAARRALIDWGASIGLTACHDAAGNLFLRLAGTDAGAAPVMTGSHMDSQPTGGKFDGIYGVLAGLEALQAFREAGIVPQRPIELVAWMNEEGSRFAPGMMGSSVFAGAATLESIVPVTDAQGTSVGQELRRLQVAFGDLPICPLGRAVHAYVEAHIEQGPVLEREGLSVGVVSGIQGKRTFAVTVTGEESHAGTSRRAERRDALLCAIASIQAMAAEFHDPEDLVRFTVGRFDVTPNAPSVVPGSVRFSIDLRHPDSSVLIRLGDEVEAICRQHALPCAVQVLELSTAMSLEFPRRVRDIIRQAANEQAIATLDIPSAAGHDARYLHAVCPSGMIFVPCKDGISHNEAESATAQDLADGARVLTATLVRLACADAPHRV